MSGYRETAPPSNGTGRDTATRRRGAFTRLGTVGVEEEFFTVDGAGYPVPAGERLVEAGGPPSLSDRLDTETYRCIVETKTPVCEGIDELGRELARIREDLVTFAGSRGYGIAAAGLHPAADSSTCEVCDSERYRKLLARLQRPQFRNTTTGLHVHVGVDDADKAVWIANEIRWYLPVMLALSANSPFHDGADTGLASARAHVFGALPNTGIPPAFDSYEEFATFRETMLRYGSAEDRGQLWWDVRPNDECGTVEIRAPDAQDSLDAVLALAEYARALVLDLAARYEDGDPPVECHDGVLSSNRWEAVRYGRDAVFVDCDGADEVGLGEVVNRESHRLDVDGISRLYLEESGAERQRRLVREGGLPAVCPALRIDSPSAERVDPGRQHRNRPVRSPRSSSLSRPGD